MKTSKTGDLARLFGVSHTTISDWIERFAIFFSEGSKGRNRSFTESDILTLATIAKLSKIDGLKLERIEERLANGERVESPSEANYGVDTRLVPAAVVEQVIDAAEIRTELEIVKAERDNLLVMLKEERDQNAEYREKQQARTDELQDEWQQRVDQLQQRINELTERAARAEAILEDRAKRRGWWG